MPDDRLRSAFRLALTALAAGLGAACSMDAPEPETPLEIPPALEPLYVQVRESRQDYERGLSLIVAGAEVEGQNLLVAATDRMAVAARLCGRTDGCDTALFLAALDQAITIAKEDDAAEPPASSSFAMVIA